MRVLMKVQMEVTAASELIESGKMPELVETALGRIRPEAAYFGTEDGKRTIFLVFDLKEPSDLPSLTESFFAVGKAAVQVTPVMTQAELKAGLKKLSQSRMAA
jgi:hypothetical protein